VCEAENNTDDLKHCQIGLQAWEQTRLALIIYCKSSAYGERHKFHLDCAGLAARQNLENKGFRFVAKIKKNANRCMNA